MGLKGHVCGIRLRIANFVARNSNNEQRNCIDVTVDQITENEAGDVYIALIGSQKVNEPLEQLAKRPDA